MKYKATYKDCVKELLDIMDLGKLAAITSVSSVGSIIVILVRLLLILFLPLSTYLYMYYVRLVGVSLRNIS